MQGFVSALEPVARIAVATLFNSLWEAALLAVAVWAILRVLPNLNATTRYAAWCVALAGSLLLPLATAIPQISVQSASKHHHTVITAPVSAAPVVPSHVKTAPVTSVPAATPGFRLPERLRFSLPQYVALPIFGLWIVAALLLLLRLGINLYRLERLKSDALPLPVDYRDRLAQWRVAEKGGRDVRLCICDRIEVPVAVGLFDSMILIPQHLLDTLSQEEIDQIMLHELAHLRRADDWTNGLQRIIQALFFFNPAVLYIAQQLDLEREVACDDWVVHQTHEVRPYATCLTKMAEVTAWPHRALAAPGVFVTRRGLSVRVERLLRAGRNVRTSVSFGPAGGVVAALVVLFFVLQSVAPSFAFTTGQPDEIIVVKKIAANPSPSPSHAPQKKTTAKTTKTKTTTKNQETIVIHKHLEGAAIPAPPAPRSTTLPNGDREIVIPEMHVHHPARNMSIPPINIDIAERHIRIPKQAMAPLPPDFAKSMADAKAAMHDFHLNVSDTQHFNCVGCDYSGQNLSGKDFRNQRLNGADFSHANLQNANFSGAVLVGVDFSGANLRGVNFTNAKLNGCDLSHTDTTGATFEGAQVVGCDVNARSLSPTQARQLIYACRNGCDFGGANLRGQDLHGLSITGVDLTGADLTGANLSGARFNGVDLSGAHMSGARVDGATFTGCDFSGVDLHNVDMSKAQMIGAKFSDGSSHTP